ncbi:hypothetical protein BSKO_08045 [Bryopsis sp. KO-2023]|nr:hypothetical protein BSKO_08045 [Bryopsis sp. KO-2023]
MNSLPIVGSSVAQRPRVSSAGAPRRLLTSCSVRARKSTNRGIVLRQTRGRSDGHNCGYGCRCRATASPASSSETVSPENTGFIAEMRERSMKLHTKDQSKEGEQENKAQPFTQWEFSREGFMKFLVESRLVYNTIEEIVNTNDEFAAFRNSGLERSAALDKDIALVEAEYGVTAPEPAADGPGNTYSKLFVELATSSPPKFICHYYNVYLAHTAGGRMIGKKATDKVLEGRFNELAFYKYESNVKSLVKNFKLTVNEVSKDWSREQKDECLEETPKSFQSSGMLVRLLFES